MAGFTKVEFIWKNGELVKWDDATTHVSAHALHYGTGVFEGMRSYDTQAGPAIFRLDAHMVRFQASARFYELHLPYTFEQLCAASLDVVRATRNHPDLSLGGSPRASVALYRAAQASAVLDARDFVTPDDVKAGAPAVLEHRLIVDLDRSLRGATAEGTVASILASVPVPPITPAGG